MKSLTFSIRPKSAVAVLFAVALSATAQAEEVVPAKAQSDAQISVWVDDAPLNLFVSQLATITGRKAYIKGDLAGQVSGQFNGSMADTLGELGEEYLVLFELNDTTLAAVSATERRSATISLGKSVAPDDDIGGLLSEPLLPGNEIQMRDGEVIVSGHPGFVERIARKVTSAVADSDRQALAVAKPVNVDSSDAASDVMAADEVTDIASQVMVDNEIGSEADDVRGGDVAGSASAQQRKPVRWVTDIPGYETF